MSLPSPSRTWRRNQHVMTATVFVVFTGFAFVIPFLPLYVRQLGVSDEKRLALWAGILIGVAPLLAGLLAPVWGRLADRHGHKRIALRALAVYAVALVLSALVRDVWQLLAARVAIGLFGGIGPLSLAMAISQAPREQTGRAVGLVQSAQILSAAVGPLIGGLLADAIGIRATFVVTATICAAAWVLVARFYVEPSPARRTGPATARAPFAELLRLPQVAPLLLLLFLANFIARSLTPILPLYLQALGVPPAQLALHAGLVISAYSIAAAVSATGLGRATRRLSPRLLLAGSLAGGAVTVLPMTLVPSFGPLLALAVLMGLLSGGSLTLGYTIGGLVVPAERRAMAFGFFSGAALFGGAVSPGVAGLLVRWDLRGIFYVDTVLFAALALSQVLTWCSERAGGCRSRKVPD